eukprot:CAMPEP_0175841438 /NCGR_PEP_ID=MMETSP0107_2-20121207/19935_1 /TAXON_ID=195067 ORGANISM="Goniomonas pacifica, Strain CCMP1869" /NCGR_SAMPLE_ID=MMETSP0107_2 /ASSEMBLY_ACC=CAM_ASM_000203 /LENGTH=34 /DNA_ID= /DNA_START= /DNA_END= /DNA_ORIENTATION=
MRDALPMKRLERFGELEAKVDAPLGAQRPLFLEP